SHRYYRSLHPFPTRRSSDLVGFPAEDLAGYTEGETLTFSLRDTTLRGEPFALRSYQVDAAGAFHAGGSARGGSGVITLPCGAGRSEEHTSELQSRFDLVCRL